MGFFLLSMILPMLPLGHWSLHVLIFVQLHVANYSCLPCHGDYNVFSLRALCYRLFWLQFPACTAASRFESRAMALTSAQSRDTTSSKSLVLLMTLSAEERVSLERHAAVYELQVCDISDGEALQRQMVQKTTIHQLIYYKCNYLCN